MLSKIFSRAFLLGAMGLIGSVQGQNSTANQTPAQVENSKRTLSVGFVIVQGFEPLDVYGPLEILLTMSAFHKITLSIISTEVGPVSCRLTQHAGSTEGSVVDYGHTIGASTIATHTFEDAPALDIIFVAGGMGVVSKEQANNTDTETFLKRRLRSAQYVLGISYGVLPLARSGLLNGKKATTNKSGWAYITDPKNGGNITWVPTARWTEDGKIWTSSGIASGLDLAYAVLKKHYGPKILDDVINLMEYTPHTNPEWDPFAAFFQVPGAKNVSRTETVGIVPGGSLNDPPKET